MFIETEETPNPNSLKFLPHQPLLSPRQTRSYMSAGETRDSPLAEILFGVDGVEGVFIAHNFLSVTKRDSADWQDLRPALLSRMMDFFSSYQDVVVASSAPPQESKVGFDNKDKEIVVKIQSILEERVQPFVARDGGDIRLTGYRDGIVYLLLRGACAGCPSSTITLRDGIENLLRYYIPEVQEVRSVADYN